MHEFVRDPVGLHEMRAQGNEHFTHNGFSGSDAAG
jgi:hypothetical protein